MIINSLLDQDFYKFSMASLALHQFSDVNVKYKFKCRNRAHFTFDMFGEMVEEIKHFCTLRFTEEELQYLSTFSFFKSDYIDFLRLYQPNLNHISMSRDVVSGEISINIEGPWFLTIFFEVPLLAVVNEVYFRHIKQDFTLIDIGDTARSRFYAKKDILDDYGRKVVDFHVADFGTRRRLSQANQEFVVSNLSSCYCFAGTSNVDLARRYNIKPIGTMAHEIFAIGQGISGVRLAESQKHMLQAWVDEYRGELGIALSDNFGIDAFLRDFDLYFAKLYDGLRHDSGDPFVWGEKVIAHYEKLGIDPKTKTLVFSDGLDIYRAREIYERFRKRITVSFGIGTNLTNDVPGTTPLQIVMKIVEVNGNPVAKVSDSAGKGMCEDPAYVEYVKKVFKIT